MWFKLLLGGILLASAEARHCSTRAHVCHDGTKVYQNPDRDCAYDNCPDDIVLYENKDNHATKAPVTAQPKDANTAAEWFALDDTSVPATMRQAAKLSFDLYKDKSVCEELEIIYQSVERKNASDFIGTKNKKSKFNKLPTESYHIVAKVECTLKGVDQVPGSFVLNMEHHGRNDVDAYQLVECGHEQEWGEITNWLTVREGRAYCQTPSQKKEFEAQPLHYVNFQYKEPTMIDNITKDKKSIVIVGAALGGCGVVLIVAIAALIQRRRKKSRSMQKWSPKKDPTEETQADDGDIEIEVNSTRGLVIENKIPNQSRLSEIRL